MNHRLGISFPKILNGNYTHWADCVCVRVCVHVGQSVTECEIYTHTRRQFSGHVRLICVHIFSIKAFYAFSFTCDIEKIDNRICHSTSEQILYVCICSSKHTNTHTHWNAPIFPCPSHSHHLFVDRYRNPNFWRWDNKSEKLKKKKRKTFRNTKNWFEYMWVCEGVCFIKRIPLSYDWKFARFALNKIFSTCI